MTAGEVPVFIPECSRFDSFPPFPRQIVHKTRSWRETRSPSWSPRRTRRRSGTWYCRRLSERWCCHSCRGGWPRSRGSAQRPWRWSRCFVRHRPSGIRSITCWTWTWWRRAVRNRSRATEEGRTQSHRCRWTRSPCCSCSSSPEKTSKTTTNKGKKPWNSNLEIHS